MPRNERCPECGCCELVYEDCSYCADGYDGHDCGEDTCCCADPEDNVRCDVCQGEGAVPVCIGSCDDGTHPTPDEETTDDA